MIRPAALSFDLNGTLLNLSRIQEALAPTCAEVAARHPEISASQLLHCNTEAWRAYWPEVERRWTLGELDDEAVGLEAWRRALRACECYEENIVQSAGQIHRRRTRELTRAFADVQYLLDWLSGKSWPLAIITNGASGSQRDALRILGNERHFSTVVISGEVHIAKPDPAIFSIAIKNLGLDPQEVWHVGDSLAEDVAGANSAGLMSVWLNRVEKVRAAHEPRPDYEIRSLRQIVDILQKSH